MKFKLMTLAVVFVLQAAVAEPVQNNLERLQALYRVTIDSVFTNVDLDGKRVVVDASAPDPFQEKILEDQALQFLNVHNADMVVADTTRDSEIYLDILSVGRRIDYMKIKRKQFERSVTVETHCQLQVDDKVLFSDIIQVSSKDTINTSNPQSLENETYKFTFGTEKPGILEPVLISALTGAIIYVFYSYRSQ